jgi:hypothetical protein
MVEEKYPNKATTYGKSHDNADYGAGFGHLFHRFVCGHLCNP